MDQDHPEKSGWSFLFFSFFKKKSRVRLPLKNPLYNHDPLLPCATLDESFTPKPSMIFSSEVKRNSF
jgi:hypothetical protein